MSPSPETSSQTPSTPMAPARRPLARKAKPGPPPEGMDYMGIGPRFWASVIDNVLLLALLIPLVMLVKQSSFVDSFITPVTDQVEWIRDVQDILSNQIETGSTEVADLPPIPHQTNPLEVLITVLLPAVAFIVFWRYRSATPGKMIFKAQIVDATHYGPPSTKQLLARYLGYYMGIMTFFLGFAVILFNKRRMGIHDLLANTAVIAPKKKKG